MNNPAIELIKWVMSDDGPSFPEDVTDVLDYWLHGQFDKIKRDYPEAPDAIFIGADPLHPGTIKQQETAAKIEKLLEDLDRELTEAKEKK